MLGLIALGLPVESAPSVPTTHRRPSVPPCPYFPPMPTPLLTSLAVEFDLGKGFGADVQSQSGVRLPPYITCTMAHFR
jgi:hypothetical protein